MISGPILSVDFITRLVTAPSVIYAPLGSDAFVSINFTGITDALVSEGVASAIYYATNVFFKEFATGEIVTQSNVWEKYGSYDPHSGVLPVTFSGPALEAAVADHGSANLIGEIQWSQSNPFYPTLGPATITTRSQTFPVRYSTGY